MTATRLPNFALYSGSSPMVWSHRLTIVERTVGLGRVPGRSELTNAVRSDSLDLPGLLVRNGSSALSGLGLSLIKKEEDIEAGRAILGRRRRNTGRHGLCVYGDPHQGFDVPEEVCLRGELGWLEVHRMALEEDELQLAKEKAILYQNFEVAAALLHRQDKIDDRLTELVRRLIGE